MKKYILMIVITILISLIIMFYNPNSKYLMVYDSDIEIIYDFEDVYCEYKLSNNNLVNYYNNEEELIYKFKIKDNGEEEIIFDCYKDDEIIYTIDYVFNIKNNKIYWVSGYGNGLLSYPNPK